MQSIFSSSSAASSPISTLPPPTPTPSNLRSLRADERRANGTIWRRVGYQSVYRSAGSSLVWNHGDIYIKSSQPSQGTFFLCDYCNIAIKTQASRSTTNFRRHLIEKHRIDFSQQQAIAGEAREQPRVEGQEEVERQEEVDRQEGLPRRYMALYTTIDGERFRTLLLRLFVYCQLPYNLIEQPDLRELLLYIQPSIDRFLTSRTTISRWITDEFAKGREVLKVVVSRAKSSVHISFDIWSSPSGAPILGICGHFLDEQYKLRHPLLALRFLGGHHTGVALAEVVAAVMVEYQIEDKWGVCVADNADNCDTCCATLVSHLRPGEPTTARRSRCFGHMVNLAAKAFIYGKSAEGFIAEAEQVMALSNRDQAAVQEEMRLWRSRGCFGKFHNVVKYIRGSALRRQRFKAIVEAVKGQQMVEMGIDGDGGSDDVPRDFRGSYLIRSTEAAAYIEEINRPVTNNLNLILDNATRWNSAFLSIQRGLRLKQALRLYLLDEKELSDDILTEEDWAQLTAIYHGLKPFWEVTLRLESHANNGSHGVIWEVLPGLEMLLTHTEQKIIELTGELPQPPPPPPSEQPTISRSNRRSHLHSSRHRAPTNPLLVCYQNAWEVLIKYNNITDKNHEIYAAATLLNPCARKQYFTRAWIGHAADQIAPMLEKNRGIWESLYSQNTPQVTSQVPHSSLSIYMANLCQPSAQGTSNDEFQLYTEGATLPWVEWNKESLFRWWNTSSFTTLRQWALDTLSIPATSSELERVFSQAKRFYPDDRNRLSIASFEAAQCLLQWRHQRVFDIGLDSFDSLSERNNDPPANRNLSFA